MKSLPTSLHFIQRYGTNMFNVLRTLIAHNELIYGMYGPVVDYLTEVKTIDYGLVDDDITVPEDTSRISFIKRLEKETDKPYSSTAETFFSGEVNTFYLDEDKKIDIFRQSRSVAVPWYGMAVQIPEYSILAKIRYCKYFEKEIPNIAKKEPGWWSDTIDIMGRKQKLHRAKVSYLKHEEDITSYMKNYLELSERFPGELIDRNASTGGWVDIDLKKLKEFENEIKERIRTQEHAVGIGRVKFFGRSSGFRLIE